MAMMQHASCAVSCGRGLRLVAVPPLRSWWRADMRSVYQVTDSDLTVSLFRSSSSVIIVYQRQWGESIHLEKGKRLK